MSLTDKEEKELPTTYYVKSHRTSEKGVPFPLSKANIKERLEVLGRQILLHFLAEQEDEADIFDQERGKVLLKLLRDDAADLGVEHVDQLIPRLVDKKYGPVLFRHPERQGTYEFVNPVLRLYIRLRNY